MLNKKLLLVLVIALLLIGCRTAPVMDVDKEPLTTSSGKALQLKTITNDIIRAGQGLGWKMKKVRPGLIIGTLHLRTHMAKVEIIYNTREYSIRYKDSKNLKYDGENIHSNYNGWITNLSNAIQTHVYNDD